MTGDKPMHFHPLMSRRTWLGAAALAAACTGTTAFAQAYPNKPIKIVVPFAAGGATDVLARVLAEKMAVGLGQPMVIDNKPGAAGIIGTDAVAKAAPDGYTLLLGLSNSMLTNQFLYTKLPYSPEKDIAPIYQIAIAPLVLVAHPKGGAAPPGPPPPPPPPPPRRGGGGGAPPPRPPRRRASPQKGGGEKGGGGGGAPPSGAP